MKRVLLSTALALALGLGYAQAQNLIKSLQGAQDPRGPVPMDSSNSVYFPNHINAFANTTKTPTVSCGASAGGTLATSSLVTGSVDAAGTINNSATTCGLTFGSPFNNAPMCVVSFGGLAATSGNTSNYAIATGTTSFQITGLGSTTMSIAYICIGNQ